MADITVELWFGPGSSQACYACFQRCPHNAGSGWLPATDERARDARFIRAVFEHEETDQPRQLCLDCLAGGEGRIREALREQAESTDDREFARHLLALAELTWGVPSIEEYWRVERLAQHKVLDEGVVIPDTARRVQLCCWYRKGEDDDG